MKKIPMRKCIGCMESKPKKELYRIVKIADDEVVFDKTGKLSGRGTYICGKECLGKVVKSKRIDKMLDVKISDESYDKLLIDINKYIK